MRANVSFQCTRVPIATVRVLLVHVRNISLVVESQQLIYIFLSVCSVLRNNRIIFLICREITTKNCFLRNLNQVHKLTNRYIDYRMYVYFRSEMRGEQKKTTTSEPQKTSLNRSIYTCILRRHSNSSGLLGKIVKNRKIRHTTGYASTAVLGSPRRSADRCIRSARG